MLPPACRDMDASWVMRDDDVRTTGTQHLAVTHLCGGSGGLKVFTGTDSNSGGHTVLLFWKTQTQQSHI